MESRIQSIIQTFSRPINHTESLLKLFHQNRLPENVIKRESVMCSKCLTPWMSGKFTLQMRSSNPKRVARRNHTIERLQQKVKSKQISETESKTLTKKIKRLQQQNNHVAFYKCFCSKTTTTAAKIKVQLRKKQNDKHNKSENVASVKIMSEKTIQHDCNPTRKEEKTKKKKKKTAGLLIPMTKKANAVALTTNNRNLSKISEMFRQQKNIDETKQQSKLNQFFK